MENILADLQLLLELGVSDLGNVHIAIPGAIAGGILVHGSLQGGGDTDVVHHQAAFLVLEHPVHAGDGLHQIITAHRFIDVHGCQRRNIKPGQPHIHNDGNLHRIVVVLEFSGEFFFPGFRADDFFPIFRIVVAAGHHDPDLFFPIWANLQNAAIDLHSDRPGVGDDHRLTGQQICPVLFVMCHDVVAEGGDSGIGAKHALHLAQHLFALLDGLRGALRFEKVVGGVNQCQGVLVQLQMHNPAFVVHRPRGAVLYGLGHIVDIDVVAEDLPGVPILGGNRRSGKANEGGVGKRVPDDSGITNYNSGLLLAGFVFAHDDSLIKPILAAVGLVRHDHDVPALRQRLFAPLKLEHGRKNDAVGCSAVQQGFQMLLAGGLDRRLAEEGRALGELGVELVVQINPVRHDNNCRTVQGVLQQVGIEDHGQGFSTALGVPEHTAFAVCHGGVLCLLNGLSDSEILVIACEDLDGLLAVPGEKDEVLYDVQQPRSLEHALVEGIKLRVGGVFIAAVLGFPFHEPVQTGSDRAGLVGGEIADHTDRVVIEHRRDVLHIIPDLVVGVFGADLVLGRAFQFHQHQRQSVYKQNDIRAPVVAVLDEGKLIDHIEGIAVQVRIVQQIDDGGAFLSFDIVLHRDAILEVIHEGPVLLNEAPALKGPNLGQSFLDCLYGQPFVDPDEAVLQNGVQQRAGIVRPVHVRRIDMGITHALEQLYDGLFVGIFCKEHGGTSFWSLQGKR